MTPSHACVKLPAGPPWSVTDPDRQRQMPESKTILTPYTMCGWASYDGKDVCTSQTQ